MDMREVSNVTDYYVIASGTSSPHIKALIEEVDRALKEKDIKCFRKSGSAESEWIIVDYIDVVVHVFSSENRGYYNLEQLWSDAERIQIAS